MQAEQNGEGVRMRLQFLHVKQSFMHCRFVDVAAYPALNISAAMDLTGRVCINCYFATIVIMAVHCRCLFGEKQHSKTTIHPWKRRFSPLMMCSVYTEMEQCTGLFA